MNENKTNESKPIIWFDGRESTRQLPAECIADCSGSGDYTNNVIAWVERLNFDGSVELFKEHLKEYGAWDDEQLEDHDENRQRVLWLWANDCYENPGDHDYLHLGV
jgi:hypothetical protein